MTEPSSSLSGTDCPPAADQTALVLFSGGQDSATCLAWALERYGRVETVAFDYGQRHSVELECRMKVVERLRKTFPEWGSRLGGDHFMDVPVLNAVSDTALTRDVAIEMGENGLPTTFVPGRNLLFLTLAGALAYRRGLKRIVTGVCETDYSGYPDCRDDTIKAMQLALNLGMDARFVLETPLMWLNKAQTWTLAERIGGVGLVDLILEETHSCYNGVRTTRHAWGYGCGTCPACELRRTGYEQYRDGLART